MTNRYSIFGFLLALLLGFALMNMLSSSSVLGVITQAVIYAIFALGVGILIKQNGLVSFGHALFFGMAGYGMGIILHQGWMSAELAILVVLLSVALVSFLIGLVIVRVPGIAFSMLTLAIGQMAFLLVSRSRGLTGGADGMSIYWPNSLFGVPESVLLRPSVMFIISWVAMLIVLFILLTLFQTRFGAITEAIRDNEERARFIGIKVTIPRALVYMVSGIVTAIAGLLSSLNSGFVSPESLHWSVSAITLLMAVVGGFKHFSGPVLGAFLYIMFKDLLGDYATHSLAVFGAILILVIVFSPEGLIGIIQRPFKSKVKADTASSAIKESNINKVETSKG